MIKYLLTTGGTFYKVTGATDDKRVEIPATNLGTPVKKISENAFKENKFIESVIVGNNVFEIGVHAFQNCPNLKSITLPKGLKTIKEQAFYGCSALKEVKFLGTAEEWSQIVFEDSSANPVCYSKELIVDGVPLREVRFNDVTKINANAFYNCRSLTKVEFSRKVNTIHDYAFGYCQNLLDVVFDKDSKLEDIACGAFYGCKWLKNITMPESVKNVDTCAFANCGSLEEIVIPKNVYHLGAYAFSSCEKLTKAVILGDIDVIKDNTFDGCNWFKSVTIPNSVRKIEKNAFCSAFNSVDVNFLGTIDEWASIEFEGGASNPLKHSGRLFINDEEVSFVEIGVEKISDFSFAGCKNIKEVTLSDSVKEIGLEAFYGAHVEKINFGNGLEKIGEYAFERSELKEVVFEDGLETIPRSAFMDCQNLKYVKLPDTLLTVGNAAFECCYALEKVDFGYGVQTIEFEAFSNCKMLREITLPVSLKTIVKTAFAKIPFRSVDFMNFLGWQLETERYLKKPKIKKINKKLLMNKEKAAEFLTKHYDVKWVNTADLSKMKKF